MTHKIKSERIAPGYYEIISDTGHVFIVNHNPHFFGPAKWHWRSAQDRFLYGDPVMTKKEALKQIAMIDE